MKVSDLKTFCKENNIPGYSKLNKTQLLELIECASVPLEEVKVVGKKTLKVKEENQSQH